MKKISILLASCITALSVFAQYNNTQNNNSQYNNNIGSTVTITVNANRGRQVLVDGRNYSNKDNSVITNRDNSVVTNNVPVFITITDLRAGQHTLQLVS